MHICLFLCASMALIQSEIVRPQVITAKCSELQADTIKVEVKEIRIIPKADVSGALNIMRKSSVVDENIVYTVEAKWTRNKNTEY